MNKIKIPDMYNWDHVARDIDLLDVGEVRSDVDLKTLSRWRIGGKASLVVEPNSAQSLSKITRYTRDRGIPRVVIGDGSNLLFDDKGVDALVVKIGRVMSNVVVDDVKIICEAGVWVPCLARRAAKCGLAGIQHVVGIPGSVGGLVCMNGGSQRKAIGDNILDVTSVDDSGNIRVVNRCDCGFGYRRSRFQNSGEIVVGCTFILEEGCARDLHRELLTILKERRKKFPTRQPNCGSVFISDPDMYKDIGPPGKVIEELGIKGIKSGNAVVSPHHANFIVNLGRATADDVLLLVYLIRHKVFAATGYWLNCEFKYLTLQGEVRSGHDAAEERYSGVLFDSLEFFT